MMLAKNYNNMFEFVKVMWTYRKSFNTNRALNRSRISTTSNRPTSRVSEVGSTTDESTF